MRSRRGYYMSPHSNGPTMLADSPHPGGKLMAPMRLLVRDYSELDDLICDPCAGGGTTLLAAAIEGRRAIGAELDPATFEKAVARLSKGYTPSIFQAVSAPVEQVDMFGGAAE
ncbi:MAG: DNA methyltransferase [Myxococcota bacterium]